ncbi:MAG: hypothetical protein BWY52_03137 [Chloroflexi bacterium ADurb.Bin325]|nr:MAG: hypothetical protein BWY52_03137 [Chloroflexi bacterium ADurb.Bin325]
MAASDLYLLPIAAAVLAGMGTLLLCLVALDLARAAGNRLWLLVSPRAARQMRFRAALAAYQLRGGKRARKSP